MTDVAFEATDIERSGIWFWIRQLWEEFFVKGPGNERGF